MKIVSPTRSQRATLPLGLLLTAVLALSGCSLVQGEAGSKAGPAIPVPTSPVVTQSIQTSLQAYRGKVVILDFWATWCPPCRAEIPSFIALQNKYRDQGVEIIGVSLDPISGRGPGASAVEPFMKSAGINYAIWLVNDGAAMQGYDVSRGIPTTYIINREGKVVNVHVGAKPMSVFENEITKLL